MRLLLHLRLLHLLLLLLLLLLLRRLLHHARRRLPTRRLAHRRLARWRRLPTHRRLHHTWLTLWLTRRHHAWPCALRRPHVQWWLHREVSRGAALLRTCDATWQMPRNTE